MLHEISSSTLTCINVVSMILNGLCGPKKKEQVPTTLRRGRQLKTMQESPELWKAEHECHHTGYCTSDVKNVALRKEGWVSY